MAKEPTEGLLKAIKLAGGKKKHLAEALGVTPMTVTQWCSRGVPAEQARKIEEHFGGEVTRAEIRPDLFGNLAVA